MDIPFEHDSFKNQNLSVKQAGWFSGAKLLINGIAAKKSKGKFVVRADTGEEMHIQLKSNLIDPIPKVVIGDQKMLLAKPLKWYEYIWMGLPIGLAFIGGAIGAFVGASACYSSARIFRGERSIFSKYALTGLISVTAVIIFFILAIVVQLLIGVK